MDDKILRKLNIGNMKSFQKSQKLKQVALMAIAVQSDPNDIKELKEIFQELDNNGDGSISFDELQAGLGKRENGAQLLEVLRAADTDNSGTINYTGKLFVRFILNRRIFGGHHGSHYLPQGAIPQGRLQNVRYRRFRQD
jgi:hypothetical protein